MKYKKYVAWTKYRSNNLTKTLSDDNADIYIHIYFIYKYVCVHIL